MNKVKWAMPSGLCRRRRLESLRSGKASGERWTGAAEPEIAVVQRPRFCDEIVKPLDEPFPAGSWTLASRAASRTWLWTNRVVP